MTEVVLIIHLILAATLIGLVLLQRSEGGALGMGGGGGGMAGFMTGRAAGDLLTRSTAIVAGLFMATSLALAVLAANTQPTRSLLDKPVPVAPAQPTQPAVPLAK